MTKPNANLDTPAPRLPGVAVYSGRVVLALGVVGVGLWTLANLGRLTERLAPAPPSEPPGAVPALPAPPASWLAALELPGGAWTIAGLPWQLSVERLPRRVAEERLLRPPAAPGHAGNADRALNALLPLVKQLGAERRAEAGYTVYLLPLGPARAALFTTGRGVEERLFLGRLVSGGEAPSCLIEATPASAPPNVGPPTPELLPAPVGARRLATRHRPDGSVLAELVAVDADEPALRAHWQQAGWQAAAVLATPGSARGVTCRHGARTVQAWLWPGTAPAQTRQTLVLQIALAAGETP